MDRECIRKAIEKATYEIIEGSEPFYAEIPEIPGLWTTGKTIEKCQEKLLSALENWLTENIEWEINDLAQLCFSERNKKDDLHSDLLLKLQRFLNKKGYSIIREYPIRFNTIRRRDGKEYVRPGYIDLYAERPNKSLLSSTTNNGSKCLPPSRIAIEFDSGNLLKYKSIEKLLQSGVKTCLGIVRGDHKCPNLFMKNKNRYLEIKNKYDDQNVNFYLIIIYDKTLSSLS